MAEVGATETSSSSSLPAGWTRQFSRSQNREYFFHAESKKSVWSLADLGKVEELKRKRPREDKVARDGGASLPKRPRQAIQKKPGISVAIIVPFRDLHVAQKRSKHLAEFAPHMASTLASAKGVSTFHIYIIEQSNDGRKFNRGKLLNIGFDLAKRRGPYDSYIFHDVDLLPHGKVLDWYAKRPTAPVHIARCWDRYNDNEKYFGGIVAFSGKDFEAIDGFPNTFWGWGGEDDEMQRRVARAALKVVSPPKTLEGGGIIDLENMDIKTKMDFLRKTNWKCKVKWEVLEEYEKLRREAAKPRWWGLRGIEYKVNEEVKMERGTCSRITVDVLGNTCDDGTEHWANNKK